MPLHLKSWKIIPKLKWYALIRSSDNTLAIDRLMPYGCYSHGLMLGLIQSPNMRSCEAQLNAPNFLMNHICIDVIG